MITNIFLGWYIFFMNTALGLFGVFDLLAEALTWGSAGLAQISIYFSALPVIRLLLPYILVVISMEMFLFTISIGKLIINFFRGSGIK